MIEGGKHGEDAWVMESLAWEARIEEEEKLEEERRRRERTIRKRGGGEKKDSGRKLKRVRMEQIGQTARGDAGAEQRRCGDGGEVGFQSGTLVFKWHPFSPTTTTPSCPVCPAASSPPAVGPDVRLEVAQEVCASSSQVSSASSNGNLHFRETSSTVCGLSQLPPAGATHHSNASWTFCLQVKHVQVGRAARNSVFFKTSAILD